MNRSEDWLAQGKRDIEAAESAMNNSFFEWTCFMCQQGAEKLLKALAQKNGMELWGHNISQMLHILAEHVGSDIPNDVSDSVGILDKLYILPRYPNGFPDGPPFKHFTKKDAEDAICSAKILSHWCDTVGSR